MSRTDQLYTLQQIDTQLDERLARVQSINRALGESEGLISARQQMQLAQDELTASQKALRVITTEVEDLTTRMATTNKRLFDGSVKNSKELGQMQHELETMKQVRTNREDQMLQTMDQVDAAQGVFTARQDDYNTVETEWRRSQTGMLEEKERLDEQLKVIHTHRNKYAATLPPADLQLYEKLRKTKRGVAIAALVHDICQGCRVQVPAGVLRQARQGTDIVMCPSCGRILHVTGRGDLVNTKQ